MSTLTSTLLAAALWTQVPVESASTTEVAQAMASAASAFLAALPDADRGKANLSFDDPKRLDWHNIPKLIRKGIQLRDMNAEQSKHCHDLLKAALSEVGYDKATKILALENNLREGEKNLVGGHLRDPLRYFLTIFGTPGSAGTWGWSFEGHHFSLNFVIKDGHVTGDTPSFWGANPATVHLFVEGGPPVGTRTLADEEQLAFDLVASFTPEQLQRAVIAPKAPDDYRAPGIPNPPAYESVGLSVADMNEEQQRTLQKLLGIYARNLAEPIAMNRFQAMHEFGIDNIYFAWAGSTKPGVGHYYRVQGPSFLLELVNIQSDPAGNPANHIHSVWRNPRGDFGLSRAE